MKIYKIIFLTNHMVPLLTCDRSLIVCSTIGLNSFNPFDESSRYARWFISWVKYYIIGYKMKNNRMKVGISHANWHLEL